jgi:hypothetical protein
MNNELKSMWKEGVAAWRGVATVLASGAERRGRAITVTTPNQNYELQKSTNIYQISFYWLNNFKIG